MKQREKQPFKLSKNDYTRPSIIIREKLHFCQILQRLLHRYENNSSANAANVALHYEIFKITPSQEVGYLHKRKEARLIFEKCGGAGGVHDMSTSKLVVNKLTPLATKQVKMPRSPVAIYSGAPVPNIMSNPLSSSDETSTVLFFLAAATVTDVLRANWLLCVCLNAAADANE
jgi:hypothetical protein